MLYAVVVCCIALGFASATSNWVPADYVNTLGADAPTLNYFGNPDDCTQYYLAFKQGGAWRVFEFKCTDGQIWAPSQLTCIPGSCDQAKVTCTTHGALLPDPENCANFYHCSQGIAYKKCCPAGLGWNATLHICDYVQSCTKAPNCSSVNQPEPVTTTLGPEPEFCIIGKYIYEKVAGNDNLYKMTNNETGTLVVESMGTPCPFNHVFSTRECGCLDPNPSHPSPDDRASCVLLDFDAAISTAKVWVGETETGCELQDGKLCFDGNGQLNIPFYNNLPFNNKIQVSFNYTSASQDAIFVANGKTVANSSFCVYLENGNVKVKIVTSQSTFVVEKKAAVGVLSVKYDGVKLFLTVAGEETSIDATGLILRKEYDLIIGSNLVGCIDDFDFCPSQ